MRDAFGGVFMFNLLLVFIFIYVAFAAVSLNYAKAFKLKNSIISFIEENEIIDYKDINSNDEFNAIIENANYKHKCPNGEGIKKAPEGYDIGYCYNGVELSSLETRIEGTNSVEINYQVITYADWNLGALNKLLALAGKSQNSQSSLNRAWTIKGTAKVVKRQ